MNPEEEKYLQDTENRLRLAQAEAMEKGVASQQVMMDMDEQEKNILKEQLDLSGELDRIDHLLRGHILKPDENGLPQWTEPTNKDLILLTEEGINYINWAIQWYLTKNLLLSNYDVDTINAKMEDISTTIADALFMKYDTYFREPTLDECKEEIEKRISKRIEIRKFAAELSGVEIDEKEIRNEILKDMEGRIERELTTIKEQKTKNRLKLYESLIRFIQDSIHSTYLRAFGGQERRTIRQHIHVSESSAPMIQQKNPQKLSLLNYGR